MDARRRRSQKSRKPFNAALHASKSDVNLATLTVHGRQRIVRKTGKYRNPPRILCLEENREDVLNFLTELRLMVDQSVPVSLSSKSYWKKVASIGDHWDFSTIDHITPTVALLIAAEYDRAHALVNRRFPAVDMHRWQPDVRSALEQVGFMDLLHIKKSPKRAGLGQRRILKFKSATIADEQPGYLIDELESVSQQLLPGSDVDFGRLYNALVEGVLNTKQHAYPATFAQKHTGQWWASGSVDMEERRISAVIYDQGVTIPVSLPHSSRWARVKARFAALVSGGEPADADLIEAAMEVSKSSTGQAHRGKGLAEMELFLETCRSGQLRILSRHGEYLASPSAPSRKLHHSTPLQGTLVQWDVVV